MTWNKYDIKYFPNQVIDSFSVALIVKHFTNHLVPQIHKQTQLSP